MSKRFKVGKLYIVLSEPGESVQVLRYTGANTLNTWSTSVVEYSSCRAYMVGSEWGMHDPIYYKEISEEELLILKMSKEG